MRRMERYFFDRPTEIVARELLGKFLIHRIEGKERVGKIVEVEAYLGPQDLAAHSARGRTKRTEVMFGPPGHAYIYLIYGMYECMNIVTEQEGHASAVLIRALEPIKGISGKTTGPGLLCRTMGITRAQNGHDLVSENFFIASAKNVEEFTIARRPRIGVDYAGRWAKRLLRFYIKNNPYISKP